MKYSAKAPGTCGELVQGYLNGEDFLINSPIPFFAEAHVSIKKNCDSIKLLPNSEYSKINRILKKFKELFNIENNLGFEVNINSKIPRSKGLASSTAELTAAVLATSAAFNISISDSEITKLLLDVDGSSDGVFLPGVSHINHLKGTIYKQYYNVPHLSFIIVDVGGEVKTQEFNRDFARAISTEHQMSMRRALSLIHDGFLTQNSKLIAQAATLSARVNQHVLCKPPLETLIEGTREFGGLGVNCGHTGTILGVMFDHTKTDYEILLKQVYALINPLPVLGVYPLIHGARLVDESSYCCPIAQML